MNYLPLSIAKGRRDVSNSLLEDCGERHLKFTGTQEAVGGFVQMAGSCNPPPARRRVNNPARRYAHFEVIVHALQIAAHPVFRGKHFDAQNRRVGGDLLVGCIVAQNTNIRDSIPLSADPDPKFRKNVIGKTWILRAKISIDSALRSAVILFSQIALLNLAIDIVAVRMVDGVEIFFE